jgi:hypothetical protein
MKKIIFLITLVWFSGFVFSQNVVKVTNVKELVRAIASNTTLELSSGRYNLSKALNIENPNIDWRYNNDEIYDPLIFNVKNLTIKGEENTEIIIDAYDGAVLSFRKCSNLKLQNLIIGHTKPADCESPVLNIQDVDGMMIDNCELYGSGEAGFYLYNVINFTFNNSVIRDCSNCIMSIGYSKNVSFKKSDFKETGNLNLITINEGTTNAYFENCLIHNNSTNNENENSNCIFFIDADCKNIKVEKCDIKNNEINRLVNNESLIILKGNTYTGNNFK